MHIKQVIVSGFKTYRDETAVPLFSPHCNLILGKNGSGKSNLLDAIAFVISDKYAHMREADRKSLMYEGAGRDASQIDVTLVFDNSDRRLPVEMKATRGGGEATNEVRIRRTMGAKKDQFLVNDSPMNMSDFHALLESAGMSRSNPYYIVEQGKIAALMRQRKRERLELFKEIAGTRTYDERRKESMKIMKETDGRKEHIETVIGVLDERLAELKGEAQEFEKYQALDTTRRSIEYSIYEREREVAVAHLEKIDKARAGGNSHAEREGSAYAAAHKAVRDAENEYEKLQTTLQKAHASKKGIQSALNHQLERRTELELRLKDLKESLSGAAGGKQQAAKELKQIQAKIKEARSKLADLTSAYSRLLSDEEGLDGREQRASQRLRDLQAKRERGSKYRTKRERDAELKRQQTKVTKQRDEAQRQVERLQEESKDQQAAVERHKKEIDAKEAQMKSHRDKADDINKKLKELETKQSEIMDQRKLNWKRENELQGEYDSLKSSLDAAHRQLQMSMDKDVWHGLEAVRKIAEELDLPGVYGPLIELFTCPQEFHLAVEITGGTSLFHVVVDNNDTATRVIQELVKRKAGRVTFIPLANISPKLPEYPESRTEAMPLIEQIQFDKKYEKAFIQTFGKTMIARDLSVGASISASHHLNTITLFGDRVDRRGALTGGHTEREEQGRLKAQAEINKNKGRYEEVSAEMTTVQEDIKQNGVDLSRVANEISRLQAEKASLRSQNQQLTHDISQMKREIKAYQDKIAKIDEKLLPPLRVTVASFETQLSSLASELSSELATGLSAAEESELASVRAEAEQLRGELVALRRRKADAEASRSEVEALLQQNLERREAELQSRLSAASQEEQKEALERDERELHLLQKQIADVQSELEKTEAEIDEATTRSTQLQTDLEKLRSRESETLRALSEDSKTIEKLLNQRSIYLKKKEEAIKKIRELGPLPSEAFEKYKNLDNRTLAKQHDKTLASLKAFTGVNKKAIDQYNTFSEQREQLLDRKKELDDGRQAIMELIQHLDMKKDEAIERTFKTIAKHFSEVFAELVPGGKATLVIETKAEGEAEEVGEEGEEEEEEEEKKEERKGAKRRAKKKKVEKPREEAGTQSYTGIGIKVSFTGASSATHQLSGGQESVVALSLIFAIQRCDPSPFYLLDEIDSALDPVHRTAVANMLAEQSKTTQFICTTFHPELLAAADKYYGVRFHSKASFVGEINLEQAQQLISVSEKEMEDMQQ